jgi:hypothetical protein
MIKETKRFIEKMPWPDIGSIEGLILYSVLGYIFVLLITSLFTPDRE